MRKPSCECGECPKCKQRLYMREWYRRKSVDERRALVARRDPDKIRARRRAAYARMVGHPVRRQERYESAEAAREGRNRQSAEWAKRNPEKRRAYKAVQRALQRGILVRPETCSVGGCERKPQAHHEDYDKPLEVEWLCAQHHADRHRGDFDF